MTWQLIENAPKDGSRILAFALSGPKDMRFAVVCWNNFIPESGYWSLVECNDSPYGDGWHENITHWMPLPPPPPTNEIR